MTFLPSFHNWLEGRDSRRIVRRPEEPYRGLENLIIEEINIPTLSEEGTFEKAKAHIDKIAQKACKSAIKSGDKLRDSEIEVLLNALKNNLGLKCPHGRPVAIKITRMEIDKWFKRIV